MEDTRYRETPFAYLSAILTFLGLTLIPATSAQAACPIGLKKVEFQAKFDWKTGMRIQVGPAHKTDTLVARIVSAGGTCRAVCDVKVFERDADQKPILMELACQDADFSAISTPATLFWETPEDMKPAIRFGTWLHGYSQADLKVERDRYSAPSSAEPGNRLARAN